MAAVQTHAHVSIPDRLDEQRAQAAEPQERTYLQLRRELDIGSFAANVVRADSGKELVPERTALGYARDAHEELFVVLSGEAALTVEGQEVEGRAGTAVFVRDPEATRAATARADGTTLLVLGGRRGEAWRPTPGEASQDFMEVYNTGDYEAALRVGEEIAETYPGNGLALYNVACMESRLERPDEALAHLRDALDDAPDLRENARTDEDFAAIRDDPRFAALIA